MGFEIVENYGLDSKSPSRKQRLQPDGPNARLSVNTNAEIVALPVHTFVYKSPLDL